MIDAVLPLTVRDLPRAQILLTSLTRNFQGLGTLWVVTRATETEAIRAALATTELPGPVQVLSELELAPELQHAFGLKGWYRQQVVKLAIAERVATPSYLTLDADVICVRKLTASDLTPAGRGLCHITPRDLHPDWYKHSRALLGLTGAGPAVSHNVTPAVLHRDGVRELMRRLESLAAADSFRPGLRGQRQRSQIALTRRLAPNARPAWVYLIAGAPWTEYALYYSWLEASGRFDTYHALSADCIYSTEHSVWRADAARFDSWDPRPLFEGAGPPYFVVVQSITQLAPSRVWGKVAPFLMPQA
jgi:hypothetical protein